MFRIGLLFTAISFFSCYDQRGRKIREELKYPNGKTQSIIYYINDSVKHGYCQIYYENGNLKDELNYLYGKENGVRKAYFENGKLKYVYNYVNGLKDGKSYEYYNDGKKYSEGFWLKGSQYKGALFFHNNGMFKNYSCSDNRGFFYILEWDSLGNKIKEDGSAFSLGTFENRFKDTIRKNEDFVFDVIVIEPPDIRAKLFIQKNAKDTSEIEVIINNGIAKCRINYIEAGLKKITIRTELIDLKRELMKSETLSKNIVVRP